MYSHAPPGYVCPFCHIIRAVEDEQVLSTQADVISRGTSVIAFVSSHQWAGNEPNVLIVPTTHFENLFDLPSTYAVEIHETAQWIALALKAAYGCDGVSTRQHNEPAGSQDVWHYHLHVTPRYQGDAFYSRTGQRQLMPASERARHAERLRAYLPTQDAGVVAPAPD